MKQGSTFILVVNLDVDITQVYSVIFTLKNKDTILTKENWTYDNGKFKIPFTQEETVQLDGRTRIEAQINFNNRSVAKSEIKDVYIGETLATRIIDDNIAIEEQKEIALDIDGEIVDTGGSTNYEELSNKPKINGVVLLGDVSLDALNIASKEYVEEEIAKFDFIKIVPELPEVGLPNRTYFVAKSNAKDNDLYDEYMWINGAWEFRGTKQIEVDLTDYVKKTDFPTKVKVGVVSVDVEKGVSADEKGLLSIYQASKYDVGKKTNVYKPITPYILDYAVMSALTDSKNHTWTDEEKASARDLLGVTDLVGDVQTILTELHAYAETLIGGEA